MNKIRFLSETRDSVTLSRSDYRKLAEAAENTADLAAVAAHRAYEGRVGWDTARQNYLTGTEAQQLLNGESPVRVWRQKRGLVQRVLADAAQISASYLAEIESGKKPGSAEAVRSIANVLNVPMEFLAEKVDAAADKTESPVIRSQNAARKLAQIAEFQSNRIEQETRAFVAQLKREAERNGLHHQLRATLDALRTTLKAIDDGDWLSIARNQDGITKGTAERDLTRIRAAVDKAVKILRDEARAV